MNSMEFVKRYNQEVKDSPAMGITISLHLIMSFALLTTIFYATPYIGIAILSAILCVSSVILLVLDISRYNEKYNKNKNND